MAPTIKVQQIILPNIVDDVNFTRVPKMDRCTTCHLAIDRDGLREVSAAVHDASEPVDLPRQRLAASDRSGRLHRLPRGHGAVGQLPRCRRTCRATDEAEEAKWEEEFDWEEPHLWDYPMLPAGMTEASCAKCHKQEVFVPKAEKLNIAYATYERAGCYACHKTRGLREPPEAGADSHEDRLEADARVGEDLDPQSAGGEADDLDAARLVQLELQLAGRRGPERGRDQRGRRVSVREQREARARR